LIERCCVLLGGSWADTAGRLGIFDWPGLATRRPRQTHPQQHHCLAEPTEVRTETLRCMCKTWEYSATQYLSSYSSGSKWTSSAVVLLCLPSMLWQCCLGIRKSLRPVKIERWRVDLVICLQRGADCLHMVQLVPLTSQNSTMLCFIKIQTYLPGTSLFRSSWKRGR